MSAALLLTPVPGGHVFRGSWEKLQELEHATCAACGEPIRRAGEQLHVHTADHALVGVKAPVCAGWPDGPPPEALDDVVRAIVREAPDDQPNGPTEAAIEALHESHLALVHWIHRAGLKLPVEVEALLRAEGDRIHDLVNAIADDVRALRLAHGETP